MLLKKDAINQLHREYFEVMEISEEQKLERIELAELLDDVFLFLFMFADAVEQVDKEEYKEMGIRRYTDALEYYGIDFGDYPEMRDYIELIIDDITNSTFDEKERELAKRNGSSKNTPGNNNNVSGFGNNGDGNNNSNKLRKSVAKATEENAQEQIQSRAINVANNEANTIFNSKEYSDAVNTGYQWKTWITEQDSKVRNTHREVDLKKIPIDKPFNVGYSLMLYPKDYSLGADPKECINCRCTVSYS